MNNFVLFFCICYLSFYANAQVDIQEENLRCGAKKVEKMYPDIYFRFDNEVETGSIEFIGKVYDTTIGIIFRLTRGTGDTKNLDKFNSLAIRFDVNATKFDSKSPDGKTVGVEKIDQNVLTTFNNKTSIKIIIGKENYEIYVNGAFQYTYGRVSDSGEMLQSASLSGPFHPSKVILNCGANQPEPNPEPEVEVTTDANC